MKRGSAFAGMLMLFLAAGCGSDPWEAQTNRVLLLESDASTRLESLQKNIGNAVETYQKNNKDEKASKTDKVLKFDAALEDCVRIKTICADIQKAKLDIESVPGTISKDQQKTLDAKFRGKIESEFKTCDERRAKLVEEVNKLKALESPAMDETSKSNIRAFLEKEQDALTEFDSLTRQR